MCKKSNADFMRFTKCYFMEITLLCDFGVMAVKIT